MEAIERRLNDNLLEEGKKLLYKRGNRPLGMIKKGGSWRAHRGYKNSRGGG